MSGEEYFEIIRGLADGAPWFGLGEFEPTLRRKPPRRASSDSDYIRRVLISWLIGRPVSDIADRAGCSPRLAYSIINHTIYESGAIDELDSWIELGLVAVVDGPLVPETAIWGEDEQEDEIDPDESNFS